MKRTKFISKKLTNHKNYLKKFPKKMTTIWERKENNETNEEEPIYKIMKKISEFGIKTHRCNKYMELLEKEKEEGTITKEKLTTELKKCNEMKEDIENDFNELSNKKLTNIEKKEVERMKKNYEMNYKNLEEIVSQRKEKRNSTF
jgi:hypothetical protein